MAFSVIRDDITRVKADAVVNTANPDPVIGGGTDRAIYDAAGADKLLAARTLIGPIAPGTAIETSAYALQAKFIIHTVCIPWSKDPSEALRVLASCYRSSLELASELGCRSVAFPLIGTGVYGIPHNTALDVARSVCKGYLADTESSMKITLVLFDKKSVESASVLSKKIKQYIDDNYVEEAFSEEYGPDEHLRSVRLYNRRMSAADEREKIAVYSNAIPGLLEEKRKSFSERIFELADERGVRDPELYGGKHELYFSKTTLSKMRKDPDFHPAKYTCIVMCLVLRLDLDETLDTLERAGWTLSRSRKEDLAVRGCIIHGIYDIREVNSFLEENGLGTLRDIK